MKHIKVYEDFVNETYYSGMDYTRFTKENGPIKYPKWIKAKLKEIIKGGFMDKVYDGEHNYMYLWLNSMGKDKFDRSKVKKEMGDTGAKLVNHYWNDLTGYTAFFFQGAAAALEVSKHIKDKVNNGEPVEPAYYEMKNYFISHDMDYNRSRIFNAALEKLDAWMRENNISTL